MTVLASVILLTARQHFIIYLSLFTFYFSFISIKENNYMKCNFIVSLFNYMKTITIPITV